MNRQIKDKSAKVPSAGAALQSGLFQFIPIPFLDDFLISLVRRRLVRRALKARGIQFNDKVPNVLASWNQKNLLHRGFGFLRSLVLKPFRKLFRSLFFWLTIRDAGRTATESYLLAHMLDRHLGAGETIDRDAARKLARAFSTAARRCELRLANHAWAGVWRRMRQLRGKKPDLEVAIEHEMPGFLEDFERRFHHALNENTPELVTG